MTREASDPDLRSEGAGKRHERPARPHRDRRLNIDPAERAQYFDRARKMTPLLALESKAGAKFVVNTHDPQVSRSLFAHRSRGEIGTLQRACAILDEEGWPRGGIFVDVGANIGTTTVPALLHEGFDEAVACEPWATNVRLLRINALLNGLEDSLRVVPAAVSNKRGRIALQLNKANWGDHRVVSKKAAPRPERGALIDVPCTTLDRLVKEGTLEADRVGLVWIDVQGHEPYVLAGGEKLLAQGMPLVMEFFPPLLRKQMDSLAEFVRTHYERVVDLRHAPDELESLPAADAIDRLALVYGGKARGEKMTDLLLLSNRSQRADPDG
jgi:FkbM family methyltransferase